MNRRLSPIVFGIWSTFACAPPQPTTPPAPQPAPPPAKVVVEPVPEAFGSLTPNLVVSDPAAAVDFYTRAFGAQPMMSIAGPDGAPMHTEIKIGNSMLMIDASSETMKDPMMLGGSPITLMLYVEDADAMFNAAVDAGAIVNMPLADQFWGDRYGELVDPFGHAWAISTHIEDLTDEQMQQRSALAMPPPPDKKKGRSKRSKKAAAPPWKAIVGTPATQKVPEGYDTVTMALCVSGAAQAIEFYQTNFGATERSRSLTPDGQILHAELQFGRDVLMLADEFAQMGGKSASTLGGSPVHIHYYVPAVDRVFGQAVQNGGSVLMPVADQFWGDRYGAFIDPVGFMWGVASHIEDVSAEQIQERAKAMAPPAEPGTEAVAAVSEPVG